MRHAAWGMAGALLCGATMAQTVTHAGQREPVNAQPRAVKKTPSIEGERIRPENGVADVALDKAWADYRQQVSIAADEVRDALNAQFDAATDKGDLEEAEKWQAVIEAFEANGMLGGDKSTRAAVANAQKQLMEAEKELIAAYGEVIKSLTKQKKINEAKAVRAERDLVVAAPRIPSDQAKNASGSGIRMDAKNAVARSIAQRKVDYEDRVAPPLDQNEWMEQQENFADRMLRQPNRFPKVFVEVVLDEDGLFRSLAEAVNSGDDTFIVAALGRFSQERLREMDAVVKETDWGRYPRADTGLTNGQVVLAAWDAVLRQLKAAENAGVVR